MDNNFEYKEEYSYLPIIMLNVTDDCNLTCKYCFVEQQPHYMTFDVAKAAADWCYNNLQKRQQLINTTFKPKMCSLNFFGGEPLLCYESIIVPLVQYCEEKYPNIFQFGITTNGTLLNQEKINFFKQHKFSILLSIDGIKEVQEFNRPCRNYYLSSFDLLQENIPILLKEYPQITFRSTGYAPTISHMFENYLFAESLGFKSWTTILDQRHPWTECEKQQYAKELKKIYSYRLKQLLQGQPILDCNIFTQAMEWGIQSILNQNFNTTSVYRCGLGTTSGAIGYDGSIYGCQEQVSKSNKNIFYLGNIFQDGIEPERHKKLLNIYYNVVKDHLIKKEQCNHCGLQKYCAETNMFCPSVLIDIYNNMQSIPDIVCFSNQCLYENSLLTLSVLLSVQNNNKYIQNYLNNFIQPIVYKKDGECNGM